MSTRRPLLLLGLLAACNASHSLKIRDGAVDLTGGTSDFGSVTLGQRVTHTITLRNIGMGPITLGAVNEAALGLGDSFALVDRTCTDHGQLAPTQTCTLEIEFAPKHEGRLGVSLELAYTDDAGDAMAQATLVGTGLLDCSIADELKRSRDSGVSAAKDDNAADVARGQAAGSALTYDDGYQGGYPAAYHDGYEAGYHDPSYGYEAAYAQGYADGHTQGLADPSACGAGNSDGGAAGFAEGVAAGHVDGYNAGYGDGYNVGYNDGISECDHGAGATGSPLPRKKAPSGRSAVPIDPLLVKACYDQGFQATRDPGAYPRAFDQAALQNADYQAGIAAGGADGHATGEAEGRAQGQADGHAQGTAAGYSDGAQERYQGCYDAAYGSAFDSAYSSGYADGAGYGSGYQDGYTDGEATGYADECGF